MKIPALRLGLAIQGPTLVVVGAMILVTPLIMGSPFWIGNSALFAIFSLFALSIGMSYGQAGILSMATGAFASIGAYGTAIVTIRYGASPYLGLVVAVCLPMTVAYPVARIVARLSPLPLSIATLVLGAIIEIVIREGGDFTGGYIGLSGIPPISIAETPLALHVLSWACVVGVLFLYCNLTHSAFGRAVSTARHNALRAVADGVDVPRILATYFTLSAAVAGLGGWLYAHDISYIAPESLGSTDISLQTLLMAIVGGARSPLGPILGACVLLTIVTYLPAAGSQGMVFGAALIIILLVAPRGLASLEWCRMFRGTAKSRQVEVSRSALRRTAITSKAGDTP